MFEAQLVKLTAITDNRKNLYIKLPLVNILNSNSQLNKENYARKFFVSFRAFWYSCAVNIPLEVAIRLLKEGKVVAVPTETVYGLAGSLQRPEALEAIFALKGRPAGNPLIVHVSDFATALPLVANVPRTFHQLADAFWPGPLTLVVPADLTAIPSVVRAGLPTVGVRAPRHPLLQAVLREVGPLAAPSANRSGRPSAVTAEQVAADFGETLPILDGGPCGCGVESTILIDQEGTWGIGRLGAITAEELKGVLGYSPEIINSREPICPGHLFCHYAPEAKLLWGIQPAEAIIGFEERAYGKEYRFFSLGSLADPAGVAHNLYTTLRQLDTAGVASACVDADFPDAGLWITIGERLRRAAGQLDPI